MSSSSGPSPPRSSTQAPSTTLGERAVSVGGDNRGTIITGTHIVQLDARCQVLRQAYLDRLRTEADQLPPFAAEPANAPILLSSVYTALLTSRPDEVTHERGTPVT